jgi:DNA-binding LacI/PurR family transcriptional regulator
VIFYSNDFYAIGGLKALKENGIRVPEDVCICGFDGVDVAKCVDPPITTVVQPINKMADIAVNTLFNMIDGELPVSKNDIIVPCEVVMRGSTG